MRRLVLALLAGAAACRPSLDEDLSHVDGPRILAVQSEPPEARPGERTTLRALYTDGRAAPLAAPLSWSFCVARPALAEPTALAAACLDGAPGALLALGGGLTVAGTVPADACSKFGPERPLASVPGQPAGRPADPDATGGYYLPGLVEAAGADEATFSVRLRCGLAGATQADAAAFEQSYTPNQNPVLEEVSLVRGDGAVEQLADGAEAAVAPGELLGVRASWPSCEAPPCAGAEPYPRFDPASRSLVASREALQVSWLATRGRFADARTGRGESDLARDVATTWTAPSEPDAAITVWLVLRDSRGGVGLRSFRLRLR
ncbi:MAG: hypothetical protein JWP97_4143 [Labilithrix sp.]|nr:hypothetical protein [Labilithrix sp.]